MAIAAGCICANAARGGRPRQCAMSAGLTITVQADDRFIAEQIWVCQEHYQQAAARKRVSLYRELNGVPTPIQGRVIGLRA